jgi:hypothetical protein
MLFFVLDENESAHSSIAHARGVYLHSMCADKKESPVSGEPIVQSAPTSDTYSDTLRMLKSWLDSEEDEQLARLFSVGHARNGDLLSACRSTDEDTAAAAFLTLQLAGHLDCGTCPDSVWDKHTGLALSCATNLKSADFEQIEHWLAGRRSRNGYKCGDEDERRIDEALVYALILDGSSRSQSVLAEMVALERLCGGTDSIAGEALGQLQSLTAAAKKLGHNLKLEPDIQTSVRASAFFLPPKYRKDSDVDVLAHTEDRILLDVSYRCGSLCGRGYFVVLRKEGNVWQYAIIRLARVS